MAYAHPHVRFYQRADDKWEWQFRARNGRRMFGSEPQGFNTRSDARRAWYAAREAVRPGVLVEEETVDL